MKKEMNTMTTTVTEQIESALRSLRRGDLHQAHVVLAEVYRTNPILEEVGRIANLIEPCQLTSEARLCLARLLDGQRAEEVQSLKSKVQSLLAKYCAQPPRDADIGRLVSA